MTLTVTHLTAAEVYIADGAEPESDYWWDKPASVEVNHQEGRVRIGVILEPGTSEAVGLYFNTSIAKDLLLALAGAIQTIEGGEAA